MDIDKCLTLNPPTFLQMRDVGGASVRTSILKGPGEGLKIRQAQRPKEACSLGLGENFRASESRSQACLDYAERSRRSQRTFVQVRAEAKLAWIMPSAAESLKKIALLRTNKLGHINGMPDLALIQKLRARSIPYQSKRSGTRWVHRSCQFGFCVILIARKLGRGRLSSRRCVQYRC